MTARGLQRLKFAAAYIDVPIEDLRMAAHNLELPSYRIAGISFEVADLRDWHEQKWLPRQREHWRQEEERRASAYAATQAALEAEREAAMRVGFVYFIGPSDGPVKVGWAVDPEKRRVELQTGCWVDLAVLGKVPGTGMLERRLHRHLEEHRVRGEWFERVPALALLEEMAQGGSNGCAVG